MILLMVLGISSNMSISWVCCLLWRMLYCRNPSLLSGGENLLESKTSTTSSVLDSSFTHPDQSIEYTGTCLQIIGHSGQELFGI